MQGNNKANIAQRIMVIIIKRNIKQEPWFLDILVDCSAEQPRLFAITGKNS